MADDRQKKRTGKAGEKIACEFLLNKGHTILERNWRCGHLEVDIISLNEDGIHFVEVKTRHASTQAPPQESVNRTKQKRITAAAAKYLATKEGKLPEEDCRFDIVSVLFTAEEVRVEYFPEAWLPVFL